MRISDWSSDVCSSDLAFVGNDVRPEILVPTAGEGRALAGPPQVDDRADIERLNRRQIAFAGIEMLARTEQQPGFHPPAARSRTTAIIAEIVDAPSLDNWIANHVSGTATLGRQRQGDRTSASVTTRQYQPTHGPVQAPQLG